MASAIELHDGSGVGFTVPGTGIIFAYGTSAPPGGALGYANACLFIQIGASQSGATGFLTNTGDKNGADFQEILTI